MQTPYDWASLVVFAGLVVLFLQRSTAEVTVDSTWQYLPPALGCAVANWLGNAGRDLGAIAVLIVTVAYIVVVLKPIQLKR
jgi:hypothetical protein|uniref:XrtV sorting system accessory protein n=1 Tax=uncultured Sphingomonas sp. TaxID=158754 RepID=UPI0035CC246E